MAHYVNPDALSAVAGYIGREYGYSGYSVAIVASDWMGGGTFEVAAGDGSRFLLTSDRWGNVREAENA